MASSRGLISLWHFHGATTHYSAWINQRSGRQFLGQVLVASYTEILAKAREHDSTIARRMRGWAVEDHQGKPVLMSYWYNKHKDVSAHAVYIDDVGDAELAMVAGYLNEKIGAGPLLIARLQKLNQSSALRAGGRKLAADVIPVATPSIN
ncbi:MULTISPECIES: hypothetical protein [Pseudomonas]|nr:MULTISPECIES: hypothetical protein [Pseudomonas]